MKDSCLNCRYEPEWSEWSKGEYARCFGYCKWDIKQIPTLPRSVRVIDENIIRYTDDSGIYTNCPTWKEKEE